MIYNLAKYDKKTTDRIISKYPNTSGYLLQNWVIKCNDKNTSGKTQIFVKSTKTNSPTGDSGATSLPPIDDSFRYRETRSENFGNNVSVSSERTDIIQTSIITFCYNTFSILTNNSLKSMGRFRIQLLLKDNTWGTRYSIPKIDQFSNSSTDWTKLCLNFTEINYGVKMIYDEKDTAHADMGSKNISITHSVY